MALTGVIEMDESALTFKVASLLVIELMVAVMVVLPPVVLNTPVAKPPEAIVATEVTDEFHVAESVIFCVELSK